MEFVFEGIYYGISKGGDDNVKKVRLEISADSFEEIRKMLEKSGFSITAEDDEDYILLQKQLHVSHLSVRNYEGERIHVPVEDIIFMESYGHSIDVICTKGRYQSSQSLKQLLESLDPAIFIRISNSVIINRRHLKEIIPSFSMKFRLRMSDDSIVEVTRSYYSSFREAFRI